LSAKGAAASEFVRRCPPAELRPTEVQVGRAKWQTTASWSTTASAVQLEPNSRIIFPRVD